MRRCLRTLPLTLLLAALGCGAASLPPYDTAAPRRADPEGRWEPIFFHTIDRRADAASLASLRKVSLRGDELEVRVWAGFGLGPLRAVVLRRSAAGWVGLHLEPNGEREITPRGGWDSLWARLEREGLLVLPDEERLEPGAVISDGICYVVEINQKGAYRAYHYCNPFEQPWPEGHRFLRIARALDTRLGLTSFASSDKIPWKVSNGMFVLVRRGRAQGAFVFDEQSALAGSPGPDGQPTGPRMAARYRWAFREGGSGPLVGAGVETGQGVADENTPVRFGPFQIRWSTGGQRVGLLHYTSAKDSPKGPDGEIAPTLDGWEQHCLQTRNASPELDVECKLDPARLRIENIDPADPRWRYEAVSDDME